MILNLFFTSLNYERIGRFVMFARLDAERRLAPRRFRMLETDWITTFTATMRMIHRIHGLAAHRWLDTHVAHATGLTDNNMHMLRIAHLTDRGEACLRHHAHFRGR